MPKHFPPPPASTTQHKQLPRLPSQLSGIVQDGENPTCSKTIRTPAAKFGTVHSLPPSAPARVHTAQKLQFPSGPLMSQSVRNAQSAPEPAASLRARQFNKMGSYGKATGSGIYVSNLHPSVDTKALNSIFQNIGPIKECYVALEKFTKKSLGYGIVHFQNSQSVLDAIIVCNGLFVLGQGIKVEDYVPPQDRQKTQPSNLYVKNFAGAFSRDEELINLFRVYGTITSWKLERDEEDPTVYKGFGYVCFQNPNSASEAIRHLNGRFLPNGKELYVSKHEPRDTRGRDPVPAQITPTSSFVARASANYPKGQMSSSSAQPYYKLPPLMAKAVTVVHTPPVTPIATPLSFAGASGFNAAAINRMNGKWKNNVYIKNISGFIDTDNELFHAFKRFGEIVSAVVMKDHLGASKGFGFVCFQDPQDAQTAIRTMNMLQLSNGKFLYCGEAQKKEERQVELRDKFRSSYDVLRSEFVNGRLKRGLSRTFVETELCNICFTEINPRDCVMFACNHLNCKSCLTNWITVLIKERQVNSILCLGEDCKMEISSAFVKTLVSKEMYEKYDRILLENFLAAQSDIVHCPTPGCDTFVEVDYTRPTRGSCKVCCFKFCTNCTDAYHGTGPCDEFEDETEKQNILTQYSNGSGLVKEKLEKRYGKQKLNKELEANLTHSFLTTNCKKCPHCKANIEKNGGCNHMECYKCKTHFCWICFRVDTRDGIYTHFQDPLNNCQVFL